MMFSSPLDTPVPPPTRILMVDDHPIVREGMAQFINLQPGLHLCCGASNAQEALAAMERCPHQLAIVDISLGQESGLELIKTLRRKYPHLSILAMSMHDEHLYAERALDAGAHGYLMKQEATQGILQAVQRVLAGDIYLSPTLTAARLAERPPRPVESPPPSPAPSGDAAAGTTPPLPGLLARLSTREFEVFHLIGLGLSTRQIAERLHRSVKTIETHQANIKDKLQLDSGRELLRFALQHQHHR